MHIDSSHPFVEVEVPIDVLVTDAPESFVVEIPVPGASVDDLDLELATPYLILHRGGSRPEMHTYAMLAHVDTESIRARLDDGVLRISARRRWTRRRRLPILSDFLLGGHVGLQAWELESGPIPIAGRRDAGGRS